MKNTPTENVGRVTVSAASYAKLRELQTHLKLVGVRRSIVSIIAEIVENNSDHIQNQIDTLKTFTTKSDQHEGKD